MIKPVASGSYPKGIYQDKTWNHPTPHHDSDQVSLSSNNRALSGILNFSSSKVSAFDAIQSGERNCHQALTGALSGGVNPYGFAASHLYAHNSRLTNLKEIARLSLLQNHLTPDYSQGAVAQAAKIKASAFDPNVKDLRSLKWISIDNDDSKDLDQISVAEKLPNGEIKLLVAIADVDALVPKGSAIDQQAALNTATVYTPAKNYHMLPEKLSTDLTSLNSDQDRLAIVTEMVVAPDGSLRSSNVYQAMVNNHAKLAYHSVSTWLEGKDPQARDPLLEPLKKDGIAEQVKLQDEAAQRLKSKRETNGFLDFDMQKPQVIMQNNQVAGITTEEKNRANELIENLMVAANGVAARFLRAHNFSVIQRVVRPPTLEHWSDMVHFAANYGETLPARADSNALERFLEKRKAADPVRYPDVALQVLKWMGRGTYELECPGDPPIGHFGLAVKDYTHSTAPNRRYPDLVTQRLLKAAINGKPSPYSVDELRQIAFHCTNQEAAIKGVGRQLTKCACALYLQPRIGERFHAVVANVSEHGAFVRLMDMPVEGRLERGSSVSSGQVLTVKLSGVDVEKGYVNFQVAHGRGKKAA